MISWVQVHIIMIILPLLLFSVMLLTDFILTGENFNTQHQYNP